MKALIALLLTMAAARETVRLSLNQKESEPLRLSFGSCFRIFTKKNHIFKTIGDNKPHLWAWMGDAAYTDNVKKAQCKI